MKMRILDLPDQDTINWLADVGFDISESIEQSQWSLDNYRGTPLWVKTPLEIAKEYDAIEHIRVIEEALLQDVDCNLPSTTISELPKDISKMLEQAGFDVRRSIFESQNFKIPVENSVVFIDTTFKTPLQWSLIKGYIEDVEALIQNGALEDPKITHWGLFHDVIEESKVSTDVKIQLLDILLEHIPLTPNLYRQTKDRITENSEFEENCTWCLSFFSKRIADEIVANKAILDFINKKWEDRPEGPNAFVMRK